MGKTAAASVIDAGIQKKIYSSRATKSKILNKQMDDIMKIVQLTLKDSNILLKDVTKKIEN